MLCFCEPMATPAPYPWQTPVFLAGKSRLPLRDSNPCPTVADNYCLYKIIKNPSDVTLMQEDVTSICTWATNDHLTLNSQKSCYMLFSRKSHPTVPALEIQS